MPLRSSNLQEIGICFLLPAFVAAFLILPAAGPPAILSEIFVLIVILEFVSSVVVVAKQSCPEGAFLETRPRSPPIF
jgi:hypothetical protein